MIPDFDEKGYLPTGIHVATMEEVEFRFGRESELRRVQAQSLHWLVDLARRAGVRRLVVNGSFATDAFEPNDVDCAPLIRPDFIADSDVARELFETLPFLSMQIVEQEDFDILVSDYFATDRQMISKGMIEIML